MFFLTRMKFQIISKEKSFWHFERLQGVIPRSSQPKTIFLVQWLASKKGLTSLSYVLKRGSSYRGCVTCG